jgi:hypothetical protein
VKCLTLTLSKLKWPAMIVVGAPPPPYRTTLVPSAGAIADKLLGRVRRLSRKTYVLPGAMKKQSPAPSKSESVLPSTLSQHSPRTIIPKCANSQCEKSRLLKKGAGDLPSRMLFIMPHGAVASSLQLTPPAICSVLKMSDNGSTFSSFWTRRQVFRTPAQYRFDHFHIYYSAIVARGFAIF